MIVGIGERTEQTNSTLTLAVSLDTLGATQKSVQTTKKPLNNPFFMGELHG